MGNAQAAINMPSKTEEETLHERTVQEGARIALVSIAK
jgi:hypothetical protein